MERLCALFTHDVTDCIWPMSEAVLPVMSANKRLVHGRVTSSYQGPSRCWASGRADRI